MNESIKRSIATGQVKMRLLCVDLDGTSVAPKAGGFDASKVKSVVKNGAGDYTLKLKYPFNAEQAINPRVFLQSLTSGVVVDDIVTSHDTINIKTVDDTGTPTDADFSALIYGCDARLNY